MNIAERYIQLHNIVINPGEEFNTSPGLIVVIPCYNEPELDKTITSLMNCTPPDTDVEIFVVINSGENVPEPVFLQNRATFDYLDTLKEQPFKVFPIWIDNIPHKHAGVGMARKIGMDAAILRFYNCNKFNDGIIIALDADTLVQPNYLVEIWQAFLTDKKLEGLTIYFEHPLNSETIKINQAITLYELHLRYVKQAFNYCGYPYSLHTIGSAFAISAKLYVKSGGMNRRKGAEDFYFLHKVFQIGRFKELVTTTISPSARMSNRVPFGTGIAVGKILEDGLFMTYRFEAFEYLKSLFDCVFKCNPDDILLHVENHSVLREVIALEEFKSKIEEIKNNSSTTQTFVKRFFAYFDAFYIIKTLNLIHTIFLSKGTITSEAIKLLNCDSEYYTESELLSCYRNLDKNIYD